MVIVRYILSKTCRRKKENLYNVTWKKDSGSKPQFDIIRIGVRDLLEDGDVTKILKARLETKLEAKA